jgi:hypothetical protein
MGASTAMQWLVKTCFHGNKYIHNSQSMKKTERPAKPRLGEMHNSQSCETVKYGYVPHGTQNQEWLCWRGPATNLPNPQLTPQTWNC